MKRLACGLAAVLMSVAPAAAQWTGFRTPKVPQTKDGKPDLNAPGPRTADGRPDLSGIWRANGELTQLVGTQGLANLEKVVQIPMLPDASARYRAEQENRMVNMSSAKCLPHGVPGSMLLPNLPFKIVQTPSLVVVLFEEFVDFRQIFLDGRALPSNPSPMWFGYSVGAWEGDTLVVRSIGFNDRTWLDLFGHDHSEALQLTERIRRTDFGHLEIDVDVVDPRTFSKPWSVKLHFNLFLDTELLEYFCENERDAGHLVGK